MDTMKSILGADASRYVIELVKSPTVHLGKRDCQYKPRHKPGQCAYITPNRNTPIS